MPLATMWTKHCEDEEDKKSTEQAVRSAGPILTVLREHLETRLANTNRPKISDYDSPSWSAKQADQNGEVRTLTDIINLLTLKD